MHHRSGLSLVALTLIALAGCSDNPTTPATDASVLGLLTAPLSLDVGEVRTLAGGEAAKLVLTGGSSGAEYLYVPFFASDDGEATLAVELTGGNVVSPSTLPSADRIPAGRTPFDLRAARAAMTADRFHARLRSAERAELGPRMARARTDVGRVRLQTSAAQAVVAPAVGSLIPLKVPNVLDSSGGSLCQLPVLQRTARVAAVTDRVIIAVDTANPPSGFDEAEYPAIARRFSDIVYPLDARNFGEPTDVDNNGRIILFYTGVVNQLTEPNSDSFVGGFFFAGDLFPVSACASSNFAEIMYLLAPDPTGAIGGNVRTEELIVRSTVGTTAHEMEHLINAGRRIYINDAESFEETWLDEALAHIAEELLFYELSGLQPRQNITLDQLRSSDRALAAVNAYQIQNLLRYSRYLEDPDEESLLGIDNLETRGASWAFLRYAADQEPGPDQEFFFNLVNSSTSGVANLTRVLGRDAIELMQSWTVSVFTDDKVPAVPNFFIQPSWNFRSVIPALRTDEEFPLPVRTLAEGTEQTFSLRGGGAAFVRFAVGGGGRAVLTTTTSGKTPASGVRVSVVRLR